MNNKEIPTNWERSRILEAAPGTQNKDQRGFFFFFFPLFNTYFVHRFKLLLKVIDQATLSQAFNESFPFINKTCYCFFIAFFYFLKIPLIYHKLRYDPKGS